VVAVVPFLPPVPTLDKLVHSTHAQIIVAIVMVEGIGGYFFRIKPANEGGVVSIASLVVIGLLIILGYSSWIDQSMWENRPDWTHCFIFYALFCISWMGACVGLYFFRKQPVLVGGVLIVIWIALSLLVILGTLDCL